MPQHPIPLEWLEKWISPALEKARQAIARVPLRAETHPQWRDADSAILSAQRAVAELRRLASWLNLPSEPDDLAVSSPGEACQRRGLHPSPSPFVSRERATEQGQQAASPRAKRSTSFRAHRDTARISRR
jgi:hypothetical protein